MTPKLTDDAVARLPLSHGRAELLEEIMSTPVLDDRPVRTPKPGGPRRRTAWLVPAAAAALVAVVAAGLAWWDSDSGTDGPGAPQVASHAPAEPGGDHVLLDAPGWSLAYYYADDDFLELQYVSGKRRLDVMANDAGSYEGYVEDRRRIVDPPADGEPVTVLGADAQLWSYSADDHTTIREVEDDRWYEVRGSGMDKAAYVELLGQLRLVDEETFEAALPDDFVSSAENDTEIDKILSEIEGVAGTLWPHGLSVETTSAQKEPYQLGAEVAGAVACAWLDEYSDAENAGDQARMDEAARVLGTSRDWPVLQRMTNTGEYSLVLWSYADQVQAGETPEGYQGGLGC